MSLQVKNCFVIRNKINHKKKLLCKAGNKPFELNEAYIHENRINYSRKKNGKRLQTVGISI